MKKLICLLLACVFCCLIVSAEECGHFNKYVSDTIFGEPIAYPEGHWISKCYMYTCYDCGATFRDINITYIVQGHNYVKIYEKHEGYNPVMHVTEYVCTTCGYIYRISLECTSAGCMIGFYSVDEPCVDH